MKSIIVSFTILSALISCAFPDSNPNTNIQLSRKKRYVVFPEGSSFSVGFCMSISTYGPAAFFTEGLNWSIVYDLPNDTRSSLQALYSKPRPIFMRRKRSDLYQKLELLMDSVGQNGKTCLYRTLCESAQIFTKENNLIDELLRLIFIFPSGKIVKDEPKHHHMYQWAHRMGLERNNCEILFPECTFSLLDFAFGGYHTEE